jgi:hypothetical protein
MLVQCKELVIGESWYHDVGWVDYARYLSWRQVDTVPWPGVSWYCMSWNPESAHFFIWLIFTASELRSNLFSPCSLFVYTFHFIDCHLKLPAPNEPSLSGRIIWNPCTKSKPSTIYCTILLQSHLIHRTNTTQFDKFYRIWPHNLPFSSSAALDQIGTK